MWSFKCVCDINIMFIQAKTIYTAYKFTRWIFNRVKITMRHVHILTAYSDSIWMFHVICNHSCFFNISRVINLTLQNSSLIKKLRSF